MKDIENLFRKHRLIAVMLLFSLTCSFLVFSFMVGVINYQIESFKLASSFHTFSIELTTPFEADDERLSALTNNENIRTAIFARTSDTEPLIAGWDGGNDDRWFVLDEGRFFSQEEIGKALQIAVVSQALYPQVLFANGKSQIQIHDAAYDIVGIGSMPNSGILFIGAPGLYEKYYPEPERADDHDHDHEESMAAGTNTAKETVIIPYTTFFNQGMTANIIRVEYNIADETELARASEYLSGLFPDDILYIPTIPEQLLSGEMRVSILRSSAIIIAAFVNIISLFVYWLICQRRTHTIYAICGGRRGYIAGLIVAEWAILVLLSYLLYLVLQVLMASLAAKLSVVLPWNPLFQAAMLGFIFGSSLVLIIPQLRKNVKIHLEVI